MILSQATSIKINAAKMPLTSDDSILLCCQDIYPDPEQLFACIRQILLEKPKE